MSKKEECQGCIGFSDEHTCEGYAEFLAISAAKDKCPNCERLTAENKILQSQLDSGMDGQSILPTELLDALKARADALESALKIIWHKSGNSGLTHGFAKEITDICRAATEQEPHRITEARNRLDEIEATEKGDSDHKPCFNCDGRGYLLQRNGIHIDCHKCNATGIATEQECEHVWSNVIRPLSEKPNRCTLCGATERGDSDG